MASELRRQVVAGVGQEVVHQLYCDVGLEEANDLPWAGVDGLLNMDVPGQQLDARRVLGLWIVAYQVCGAMLNDIET